MRRARHRAWLIPLLLTLGTRLAAAQDTSTIRPPGVTDSAIAWGRSLFHGSANCSACHGKNGSGTDAAPPLTGALWLHGPGTYEWLVQQIREGIPAHHSMSGLAMPMRGWTTMNDDDVRAVAAYVWSITHPPRPPKSDPRPS